MVNKYIPGRQRTDALHRIQYYKMEVRNRKRLGSYCVHDSYLLHRLNKARNIIVIIIQFSSVFESFKWVYLRGQQVRFISQVYDAARTFEDLPLLIKLLKRGLLEQATIQVSGATVNDRS